MKLLKGKGKSSMVDISNHELNEMLGSFVDSNNINNALVVLDDEQLKKSVAIPEGQTIGHLRGTLSARIKTMEPIIKEMTEKMLGQ